MACPEARRTPRIPAHGAVGAALIIAGEALILIRIRPLSDYYFPLTWAGFILVLDAALKRYTGRSLWCDARRLFAAMFCISIGFWWLFELLNQAVHNWTYIGAQQYSSVGYVALASLDFSFVLPAVWTAAFAVRAFVPGRPAHSAMREAVPLSVLRLSVVAGLACVLLAVIQPGYAFGLIWLCVFLLLDPLNYWLGRPSMLMLLWTRQWQLPISFALGTLLCGVFWEGWNYWAMPKWVYSIPHVGFWHIFEMPLLGWTGYLPFGLELFAMTNFVLPSLGIGEVTKNLTLIAADTAAQPANSPLRTAEVQA
jgi:hypothetical protein